MSDERLTISRDYCDGVGDGLRYAYGGTDHYYPSQWENAIKGLKKTLGTKNISANGDYLASADNLDGFSGVHVDVANTYTQADEGKVVDSGALVAQTSKTITTNGTHVTTTNNQVIVNVPTGGGGALAKLGSSSEIVTLSGQYGPMGNASNDYVTPVSSDTRQNVTINTAQPFEIKCTFKLTQAFTDPTYILGDLTNNTGTPQIVLRSFNGDYFQLVSYYNNGGTATQRAESFYPSENYSLPLNTDIEIVVTYDGTDLTASMDDGTDQASVTFSNYTPYATNDAVCEFGGSQGGLYGLAGNSGAYLNIEKCYIKQGSTYLWKAESGGNTKNPYIDAKYSGFSYSYIALNGRFYAYDGSNIYLNFYEIDAGKYCFFVGETVSNRFRANFYANKQFSDFSGYISTPQTTQAIYDGTSVTGSTELTDDKLTNRIFYTAQTAGVLIIMTSGYSINAPSMLFKITDV